MGFPRHYTPKEHDHQRIVCQWLDAKGILYFAVPNGTQMAGNPGQRAIQTNKLKRTGLRPGAPDLVLVRDGEFPIALEMKRDDKCKLRPEQKLFLPLLEAAGWLVIVGYGSEDAITKLEEVL